MSVVVPRNTTVPTKKEKGFTTTCDDQTSVTFEVYEGERPKTTDNILLDKFFLSDIPAAPRGVDSITVFFDIDANGILNVTATDRTTGNENHIIISNVTGILSKDEIDKMLDEAERFMLKDEELKKKFDAKKSLENYVYRTRAAFFSKNLACKLPASEAKKLEDEIKPAIEWLDEHKDVQIDVFENKRKDLESIWNPIVSKF